VKVVLGETEDGNSRTGYIPGLERGRWYWRAFAVQDGVPYAGMPIEPFVVGSEVMTAVGYVQNVNAKQAYDGVSHYGTPSPEFTSDNWIILDIGALPDGYKLECLRLWPRSSQYAGRFQAGYVDLGYEMAGGVDFGETTLVGEAGARKVYQVTAGYPANVEWKTFVSLGSQCYPYKTTTPAVFFGKGDLRQHPRFIRVRDVAYFDVNELELRMSQKPQAGFVIFVR